MKPFVILIILAPFLLACSNDDDANDLPGPETRPYYMGFNNSAPNAVDIDLIIQVLNIWTLRADAAIINTEVPWEELLEGQTPIEHVQNNFEGLAAFYRSKNLRLWVYIDPQNGLDRASDALELQAAGRSIAELEMQALYRRYVVVMDSLLKPEHLGLALETNLIRDVSTPQIYQGIKTATNEVAQELKDRNTQAAISVSVQADHAWGKLIGGEYQGISQDLLDFPFIDELGISSYPYFGFTDPEDIPTNYYSRLVEGHDLKVFISEGGWTSETLTAGPVTIESNAEKQKRYLEHHEKLLKEVSSKAVFQLLFTDIDISQVPEPVPENLKFFTFIGLMDVDMNPKPALEAWDQQFKKQLEF